jgi:hypothetical protein
VAAAHPAAGCSTPPAGGPRAGRCLHPAAPRLCPDGHHLGLAEAGSRRGRLLYALFATCPPGASALLLRLARVDEGLRVSYSARLELPKTIDEALHKGVPLYFQAELRISRQRWYWRDATVARAERQWRLAFQPLTRQYRVSTGGLHQGFDTLAEALTMIGRASAWEVALREEAQADAGYEMSFRLRLDTTQLPGPLQIGLGLGGFIERHQGWLYWVNLGVGAVLGQVRQPAAAQAGRHLAGRWWACCRGC